MSDDPISTQVVTADMGTLPFQEYFVRHQFQPHVKDFYFQGAEQSKPAPGVLESLRAADVVVICPSNPWVSIGPILAVPGIREEISKKPLMAVSPIVGGKAIKGPAAKMYQELGLEPSAVTVARHYGTLLSGFILDVVDADQAGIIDQSGIISMVTQTVMITADDRRNLAAEVVHFCERFPRRVDHP
jgi:LPPG:FO 2-phospho-L-lactate transferase